jgi:hypothetical protein
MPGEPGSGMDQQYCTDISGIRQALNRIANCAEAAEKRAREEESRAKELAMHLISQAKGLIDEMDQEAAAEEASGGDPAER